jgi:hypothetical protein
MQIAKEWQLPKIKHNSYFKKFRKHYRNWSRFYPFGVKQILYTDWTASGRLYRPIEEKLMNEFGPFVANTHTETTVSELRWLRLIIEQDTLL